MSHNFRLMIALLTRSFPLPTGERSKVREIKEKSFLPVTLTLSLSLRGRGDFQQQCAEG
jgi:hypothetical protein